jgi:hypothetical protein
LVAGLGWSGGAAEHPAEWVLLGPDGRLAVDGEASTVVRHVEDGRTVTLQEIVR